MSEINRTDADAIIEVARTTAVPAELDTDKPLAVIVPENATLVQPDIHAWREMPVRPTGTYKPATVDSLIAHAKRNGTDSLTVWVHPTSGKVVAVYDDNHPEYPGYREHRAVLNLEKTPEWVYWAGKDGVMMTQVEFAEHIEGGLEEIVEPDAADVLEIAQSFHATNNASFRSSTRLHSGEQRLQYDEEVQATAGTAGDMTVPTRILLGIAPFVGEEPYRLMARLRFRLHGGKLTLGYKLDRPDRVVAEAVDAIAEKLAGEFANVYVGEPA